MAETYFKLGWRLTPLQGKRPYLAIWQYSHLSEEEFENLRGPRDNVGVITGWLSQEHKMALMALDVDQPQLLGFNPQPWLDRGAMAHTTSTAPRIVFYTDSPEVVEFSRKLQVLASSLSEEERGLLNEKAKGKESVVALEVMGEGHLFMAPPSRHPDTSATLEWIAGPHPPENSLVLHSLKELKELLYCSVENKGLLDGLFPRSLGSIEISKPKPKRKESLRPCFAKLIERVELSHDERVALVNELEHQGYSLEEVKGIFHEHRSWNSNYDLEKTEKQVESVYGHYGHFTHEELQERGICFEGCERIGWDDCRKGSPIILRGGRGLFIAESSDGFIEHQSGFYRRLGDRWIVAELTLVRGVEVVNTKEGEKRYSTVRPVLIYNRSGDRGYLDPREKAIEFDGRSVVLEGTELRASLETLMGYETVLSYLKGRDEDLSSVYSDLKERVKRYVNLNWDPRLYDLVCCIIIATYFFDVFKAFAIIFIFGPPETGKSRLVKVLVYGSRKGLLWVSPTPAPIYRSIDAIRPTLGIDEFTKVYEELLQLTRAIYKKGLLVPRMEKAGRGERMLLTFFETYTPLILGSTKELDPMTMSRSIIIHMRRTEDPNPDKRDPEPWDFEDLRDRLYILRLTKAHEIDGIKQTLDKENPLQGREYEIWAPILTVAKAVDKEVYSSLLSLARELYERKYEGLYEEEKDVLTAIKELFNIADQSTINDGEKTLQFYPKDVSDKLFTLKAEEYGYSGEYQAALDKGVSEGEAIQLDRLASQERREARRRFEEDYGPKRIGWILKRLGLRYEHTARGNRYSLRLSDFGDLCRRFDLKLEGV